MVSQEQWDKVFEKASEDMLQTLNTFGPSETLSLLVRFSGHDPVVNQLLMKYPSTVAIGEFLSRIRFCESSDKNIPIQNINRFKEKHNARRKGKKKCPLHNLQENFGLQTPDECHQTR